MKSTRLFEISAWALYFIVVQSINATSVLMEQARRGPVHNIWEPFTWEYSSGLVTFLLIPLILRLDSYFPLTETGWKRSLGAHIAATVPFSLVHVTGMVAIRKLVYVLNDRYYDFGNILLELVYEYRKDFVTYFFILAVVYGYRLFRARQRGASYSETASTSSTVHFMVKNKGQTIRVDADQVDWIEAAGNYVLLHIGDTAHPLRDTMKGIEARLSDQFCRVHRSAIVNLSRVASIHPTSSGDASVRLMDGVEVKCSRTLKPNLVRCLTARA